MEKHQVLLICMLPLLCEGLQRIMQKWEDVEIHYLECTTPQQIDTCLENSHPGMILIAGEKENDSSTHLISNLLKRFEDVPIVWIELETNFLRMYTSHSLPARSADLLAAVREISIPSTERKAGAGSQRR